MVLLGVLSGYFCLWSTDERIIWDPVFTRKVRLTQICASGLLRTSTRQEWERNKSKAVKLAEDTLNYRGIGASPEPEQGLWKLPIFDDKWLTVEAIEKAIQKSRMIPELRWFEDEELHVFETLAAGYKVQDDEDKDE